jgi:hypothetical protein
MITLLFISIVFSGCFGNDTESDNNENDEKNDNGEKKDNNENESIPPNITFIKNDVENKLTVDRSFPTDVLWSELEIVGSCNSSSLGLYVLAGDQITNCSGSIRIRHIPTNTLIGIWDFT